MEKISIEGWVCVVKAYDDIFFLDEIHVSKENWLANFDRLGYDKDYELIDVVKISYNKEV